MEGGVGQARIAHRWPSKDRAVPPPLCGAASASAWEACVQLKGGGNSVVGRGRGGDGRTGIGRAREAGGEELRSGRRLGDAARGVPGAGAILPGGRLGEV